MASNPYVNKISVNGNVVLDLTGDGVTSPDVRAGISFHDKSGAQKVGSMPEQGAQTITPSLSPQTIAGGKYLTGEQTISAITAALLAQLDSDFTAENIAKDVNLFGLIGTHEGGAADVKKWTATVVSDSNQYRNTMVDTDSWVAQHYADANLNVAIRAISIVNQTYTLVASWGSNSVVPAGNTSIYGTRLHRASNSNAVAATNTYPLTTTSSSTGIIRVTNTGDIIFTTSGSYYLRAGTYSIVAWLA